MTWSMILQWSCVLIAYLLLGSVHGQEENGTLRLPVSTNVPTNPDWTGGSWGPWSSWSSCSRTCGRGVSTQTRRCLDDSKSLRHIRHRRMRSRRENSQCLGIYKRFHLCEIRPCQVPVDLRREACAAFDVKPFRGRLYNWEPHLTEPDSCALNCRPQGHKFYITLSSKVEDGTSCSADPLLSERICVAGQCKSIGCDGILGSERLLDQCGICGGDNTTCRIFSGYYTKPTLPFGYNLIAKIPTGARNINVTELRNSKNYLALRTEDGEFVINGNWKIVSSGQYKALGTVFHYVKSDPLDHQGERVFAVGPTDKPLHLLLMYQQYNPGVHYSYALSLKADNRTSTNNSRWESTSPWHQNSVHDLKKPHQKRGNQKGDRKPREHIKRSRKRRRNRTHRHRPNNVLNDVPSDQQPAPSDHYRWRVTGYTDCSRTCGGGSSQTMIACYKRDTFTVVSESFCESRKKPPSHSIPCNTQSCPSSWVEGPWTPCSTTCGEGHQTRKVSCILTTSSSQVTVDDAQCLGQTTPLSNRTCKSSSCSEGWKMEDWRKCSAECGKGLRKRKVVCVKEVCPEPKPDEEEVCEMGPCESIWLSSPWRDVNCTNACHSTDGVQKRNVVCIHGLRRTKDDSCNQKSQPINTRPCVYQDPCRGQWFTGPWTKCSEICGEGNRTRDVVCMSFAKGHWHTALPINCDATSKPHHTESCLMAACEQEWYTTDWSQCTKSCDGGIQSREVMCLSKELTASQRCPEYLRPSVRQPCNAEACPELRQKDSGCGDKLTNCHLVVQARLCRYDYYRNICCDSCHLYQNRNASVVKGPAKTL